jgi:hypothetical protein
MISPTAHPATMSLPSVTAREDSKMVAVGNTNQIQNESHLINGWLCCFHGGLYIGLQSAPNSFVRKLIRCQKKHKEGAY